MIFTDFSFLSVFIGCYPCTLYTSGVHTCMSSVVIIGGGISGLAAAYRLHKLDPTLEFTLIERDAYFGGKLLTEQVDGFVIEGAPDSFLSRKARGVGLCEELGIAHTLYGRDPHHSGSFVKIGGALHPLPSGLSGMIPTDLQALADNPLISPAGKERLAQEVNLPPAPQDADYADESVATFVSRRLGREVYEKLVEPLMSGIYAGNGDQLSLAATFPQLRQLELKHGSLLKGLTVSAESGVRSAESGGQSTNQLRPPYPPFVSLPGGMGTLVEAILGQLPAKALRSGVGVTYVRRNRSRPGYMVALDNGAVVAADGLIVTTPAFVTAQLVDSLDPALAVAHAAIPYASSAIVTLAYTLDSIRCSRYGDLAQAPNGYGYVIPRIGNSDVLACTLSSNKWTGRAPEGTFLLRVYLGRYGQRDVTHCRDSELLSLARQEVQETLRIDATPLVQRIYRWPLSMPQYILGHLDRLAQIENRLSHHPGLFLAGAAYRGVGIPDCIQSGERAAQAAVDYLKLVV
jgi:protoporphyrinogen/coproporphyrinogen III oxidase